MNIHRRPINNRANINFRDDFVCDWLMSFHLLRRDQIRLGLHALRLSAGQLLGTA